MKRMTSSKTFIVDLETFSSADLPRTGVFKYAEAPDFQILLMSYAFDDEPVRVHDFLADGTPDWLAEVLTDPSVIKVAHNYQFERACFHAALGVYSPPEQWVDTMHLARMNGLPGALDAVGVVLQLEQQKLDTGKSLINYFCKPCKATKTNGGRTRNLPEQAPEKWAQFIEYCRRDTEAEREIFRRLRAFPVTKTERKVAALDARINETGVEIDPVMARAAIEIDETFKAIHTKEMQRLTGLPNPNSVSQLKAFLSTVGLEVDALDKKAVKELRGRMTDPTTKRVLELRQLLGKSSTAKYRAMIDAACHDNRVRGTLQYYGAGRTGRWAGRILQPQNLPQNHLDCIEDVREIVKAGNLEGLELLYDSVPDVLSQLIRTAIVAGEGKTFLVADYHAIEAVCIAYLAGEQWRLNVFAGDGKIYEASYAQAFGVPVESVTKGSPERQKGKVLELACGYGGGINAMKNFGADKLGLDDGQLQELVSKWRAASPAIPRLWRNCEKAAKTAIETPGWAVKVYRKGFDREVCSYRRDMDALRCMLPSGRLLSYWGAQVVDGKIVFMGQNQTTRKWERMETYGGKLVENIIQAFARDVLAEAMLRLDAAGYKIVFSVHDELVVEEPIGGRSWGSMAGIMGQPVSWAPGLDRYLHADGYETSFYIKA